MEFVLRCNDLKCRVQLHDRAVVTTCSHVFCTHCGDRSGLSRTPSANRQCPACGTTLTNPDDVVCAALNPSEDYKTSILSGLAPSIILECVSRGLQFHSYQASQEIIYQEHLAKNLTEKYSTLNQQMDQLIHEANSQIKMLQDKLQTVQTEQAGLANKNHELVEALRDKSRSLQQVQKLYQSLKAQVMASHITHAADDQADLAVHTARGDRFINKIPGARTGTGSHTQLNNQQQSSEGRHIRNTSRSSGSAGQHRGGFGFAGAWNPQSGNPNLGGGRVFTGRGCSIHDIVKRWLTSPPESAPTSTPVQHGTRSRLPVLGGGRANALLATEPGPAYQPSPVLRQATGAAPRDMGGFGFGVKTAKRSSGLFGR